MDAVLECVTALLRSAPGSEEQRMANEWLVQFEQSPEALHAAVQLLQSCRTTHIPTEGIFFACQIVLTRVRRDWHAVAVSEWDLVAQLFLELLHDATASFTACGGSWDTATGSNAEPRLLFSRLCITTLNIVFRRSVDRPTLLELVAQAVSEPTSCLLLELLAIVPDEFSSFWGMHADDSSQLLIDIMISSKASVLQLVMSALDSSTASDTSRGIYGGIGGVDTASATRLAQESIQNSALICLRSWAACQVQTARPHDDGFRDSSGPMSMQPIGVSLQDLASASSLLNHLCAFITASSPQSASLHDNTSNTTTNRSVETHSITAIAHGNLALEVLLEAVSNASGTGDMVQDHATLGNPFCLILETMLRGVGQPMSALVRTREQIEVHGNVHELVLERWRRCVQVAKLIAQTRLPLLTHMIVYSAGNLELAGTINALIDALLKLLLDAVACPLDCAIVYAGLDFWEVASAQFEHALSVARAAAVAYSSSAAIPECILASTEYFSLILSKYVNALTECATVRCMGLFEVGFPSPQVSLRVHEHYARFDADEFVSMRVRVFDTMLDLCLQWPGGGRSSTDNGELVGNSSHESASALNRCVKLLANTLLEADPSSEWHLVEASLHLLSATAQAAEEHVGTLYDDDEDGDEEDDNGDDEDEQASAVGRTDGRTHSPFTKNHANSSTTRAIGCRTNGALLQHMQPRRIPHHLMVHAATDSFVDNHLSTDMNRQKQYDLSDFTTRLVHPQCPNTAAFDVMLLHVLGALTVGIHLQPWVVRRGICRLITELSPWMKLRLTTPLHSPAVLVQTAATDINKGRGVILSMPPCVAMLVLASEYLMRCVLVKRGGLGKRAAWAMHSLLNASISVELVHLLHTVPICLLNFSEEDERQVSGYPSSFPDIVSASNALLHHMWTSESPTSHDCVSSPSSSTAFVYWLRVCSRLNICALQAEECVVHGGSWNGGSNVGGGGHISSGGSVSSHASGGSGGGTDRSPSVGEQRLYQCIEPALVVLHDVTQQEQHSGNVNSNSIAHRVMCALRHVNEFLRGIAESPGRALVRSRFVVRVLLRHICRCICVVESLVLFPQQEAQFPTTTAACQQTQVFNNNNIKSPNSKLHPVVPNVHMRLELCAMLSESYTLMYRCGSARSDALNRTVVLFAVRSFSALGLPVCLDCLRAVLLSTEYSAPNTSQSLPGVVVGGGSSSGRGSSKLFLDENMGDALAEVGRAVMAAVPPWSETVHPASGPLSSSWAVQNNGRGGGGAGGASESAVVSPSSLESLHVPGLGSSFFKLMRVAAQDHSKALLSFVDGSHTTLLQVNIYAACRYISDDNNVDNIRASSNSGDSTLRDAVTLLRSCLAVPSELDTQTRNPYVSVVCNCASTIVCFVFVVLTMGISQHKGLAKAASDCLSSLLCGIDGTHEHTIRAIELVVLGHQQGGFQHQHKHEYQYADDAPPDDVLYSRANQALAFVSEETRQVIAHTLFGFTMYSRRFYLFLQDVALVLGGNMSECVFIDTYRTQLNNNNNENTGGPEGDSVFMPRDRTFIPDHVIGKSEEEDLDVDIFD